MNILTFSITNLSQLQHGITATHRFDTAGGTIGSEGASWLISDRNGRVAPIHCEIRWIEGRFCVVDHCNRTYLNDETCSLGQHSPRCLQEGDSLRVGGYLLQVHHQRENTAARSLEDFFIPERRAFDLLLADIPTDARQTEPSDIRTAADICALFEPGVGHDPLTALDAIPHKTPRQMTQQPCPITGGRP